MLHPALHKLAESLKATLADTEGWGDASQVYLPTATRAELRQWVEAIDWHDAIFDVGVEALKAMQDRQKSK